MKTQPPRVTIVTTTYHWPGVLKLAMESALAQTFGDFEYLIIGDGCTDETEETVRAFNDPRIRWHNLPVNSGNQAEPNRVALQLARGEWLAYLNHDDLWLPHHLATMMEVLRDPGVDLAHTLCLEVAPPGSPYRSVQGMPQTGFFGPDKVMILTTTLMHRVDAARAIGGWLNWLDLKELPTLNFIRRLIGHRDALRTIQEVTAVKFNSGDRKNCYLEKRADEQIRFLDLIRHDRNWLQRELLQALYCVMSGMQAPKIPHAPMPVDAPPGWQIEQWRLIRGLEAMIPLDD